MRITLREDIVNPVYREYMDCPVRHLHFYGGAGSGKSYAAAEKVIYRSFYEPRHRFLITRKIARTIRKSQFALLLDVLAAWGLSHRVQVRRTEMEIVFPNGNEIVSAGLDDPEKIKSIAGITGIWIEEPTELEERDYNQLNLRLRGETAHYKQILSTYNPIHEGHWIRRRFHVDPVDDCLLLHTTYRDNLFLDDEYVHELERLADLDAEYHTIYTLGEWATPTDTIIKRWKTVPTLPETGIVARAFGLDFGVTMPTAFVEVLWIDRDSSPFRGTVREANEGARGLYVHEHIYRTNLSNEEIIDEMRNIGISRTDFIAADSAEPDRIEEIYRAGFNIHAANKAVKYGLDYLRRFTLHITEESVNTLREVPAYKWRKDKNGIVLDEPLKFDDHTPDAIRYAALTGAEYFGLIDRHEPDPIYSFRRRRPPRSSFLDGYD